MIKALPLRAGTLYAVEINGKLSLLRRLEADIQVTCCR